LLSESYANRFVRLASDNRYSQEAVENICGYICWGDHDKRILAIGALGYLKEDSTLQLLLSLLNKCEQSLEHGTPLDLPGSELHAMDVAGHICETLARIDNRAAHAELAKRCTDSKNVYLRAMAITATGLECNWCDENLIRRYLNQKRCARLRVAALNAIFLTGGHRLATFEPIVRPLLADPSPWVVISAVEVLALLIADDDEIIPALRPLLDDHRYCRPYHTSVALFVSSYFAE